MRLIRGYLRYAKLTSSLVGSAHIAMGLSFFPPPVTLDLLCHLKTGDEEMIRQPYVPCVQKVLSEMVSGCEDTVHVIC